MLSLYIQTRETKMSIPYIDQILYSDNVEEQKLILKQMNVHYGRLQKTLELINLVTKIQNRPHPLLLKLTTLKALMNLGDDELHKLAYKAVEKLTGS